MSRSKPRHGNKEENYVTRSSQFNVSEVGPEVGRNVATIEGAKVMLPIGQRVSVKVSAQEPAPFGKIAGYGIDHITGDSPREVYLVELDNGDYMANRKMFVRMIVAHPDNLLLAN